MGKRDLDFKMFLVHRASDVILSELGVHVEDLEPTESEPQPQPRERRLDRAFLTWLEKVRRYIHFEVQHTTDTYMGYRVMEYDVQLMFSRKNPEEWYPVLSIILWPRKVPNIPEPPLRIQIAEGMEIVWPFINIKVFEWTKEKLQTNLPGILILAPLVPDVMVDDLELYAQRLYNTTEREEREAAGALFLTFVEERYHTRKQWGTIWKQVTQMLKKVGFEMDAIDEMILNTHVYQRGVRVAVKEAKKERDIEILHKLWVRKFGAPTPDIEKAMKVASMKAINRILEQMVDSAYTLELARKDLGI